MGKNIIRAYLSAYVTVIATDNYLPGALALHASLKATGARYPMVIAVGSSVSPKTENILQNNNLQTIRIDKPDFTETLNQQKKHWLHALDKLAVFSLTEFNKLVYIDSDMLVLKNLDHLFEKPHMSAVQAGRSFPGNESWAGINSGLMVVEPKAGLYETLQGRIPEVMGESRLNIGDQDIINHYYDHWPESDNQLLNESYNVLALYIDYYMKNRGAIFKGEKLKVVHFIGAEKPWMKSPVKQLWHIAWLLKQGKKYEAWYFIIYVLLIYGVKLHMNIKGLFGHIILNNHGKTN